MVFANSKFRSRNIIVLVLLSLLLLAGCESEDCLNCVELPPPVVPTGVRSISGDNSVEVQWYDISYAPYDGQYNANVTGYAIYSRIYQYGDEDNPGRTFYFMDEVAWNQNFHELSGLHWWVDVDAENGIEYEYAVAAINSNGLESALSYELVTDAPLPMGSIDLFDYNGSHPSLSGFDFSALEAGRIDPRPMGTEADVLVFFQDGVPYLQAVNDLVHIQDFGVFDDGLDGLVFEGVSWAPGGGYSNTGILEIIENHIYVVKIENEHNGIAHFAKLGINTIDTGEGIIGTYWAYQLIEGLPELSVPEDPKPNHEKPKTLSL